MPATDDSGLDEEDKSVMIDSPMWGNTTEQLNRFSFLDTPVSFVDRALMYLLAHVELLLFRSHLQHRLQAKMMLRKRMERLRPSRAPPLQQNQRMLKLLVHMAIET